MSRSKHTEAQMIVAVHLTSRENRWLDTISFSVLGQMDNNRLQLHS